jgi:NTF2 fold immunity protein
VFPVKRRMKQIEVAWRMFTVALALGAFSCARTEPKPRMTESDVVRAAKAEMTSRFPHAVAANEPYHAEFREGVWSVSGTVSAGVRGGGAPEATVRDSDGKVTDVHLSR